MKLLELVLGGTLLALSMSNLSYAVSINSTGTNGPWNVREFLFVPGTDINAHFSMDTGVARETASGGLVFDLEIKVSDIKNGSADIAIDKDVENKTGIKWTDFHVDLGTGLGDNFVKSIGGDGLSFSTTPAPRDELGLLTNAKMTEDTVDFTGGSGIESGQRTAFWLGLVITDPDGDGMTTFTIRQRATIPEPSTLLLFSAGLLCILRTGRNWGRFSWNGLRS